MKIFIFPWEEMLQLTLSKAVRPSIINGWLYIFLYDFGVSSNVVSNCTVREVTLILSVVR